MLGVRAKSLGVCDKVELVGEGLFDLLNVFFTDFYRVFDIQKAEAGECDGTASM